MNAVSAPLPGTSEALADAILSPDPEAWATLLDGTEARYLDLMMLGARSALALAQWVDRTGEMAGLYEGLGIPRGGNPLRVLAWLLQTWQPGTGPSVPMVEEWLLALGARALRSALNDPLAPWKEQARILSGCSRAVYDIQDQEWEPERHMGLVDHQHAVVQDVLSAGVQVVRDRATHVAPEAVDSWVAQEAHRVVTEVVRAYQADRWAPNRLREADILMLAVSEDTNGRAAAVVLSAHVHEAVEE